MERATPPGPDGKFIRTWIVETKEKYPFIRVEEKWRRDLATGAETLEHSEAMVADHFLTRLRDGQSLASLEAFLLQAGGTVRRVLPNSPLVLVKVPAIGLDEYDALLGRLRGAGSPLAYAEPDFVVHATFTPNDPSFSSLWGLNNTGQTGGTGDADIDGPEAWEVTRGSSSVVVGIIDSGIDYTHPDLVANMWTNPGEIPGNGIDDDGNGYIDDTRGWDFANGDNDPLDDHYHGTHCAGTIGGVGNNGIGVAGVCHTVRLMPLKFLSASGSGETSDAVEAVLYATAKGATLTSNSWGGGGYSQALKDAIDAARAAGILFIAAAGNESSNTDTYPSYPSCYDSANIISVAATDHTDTIASFSNYGVSTVDLAAPGVSIYSTSPGNSYRVLSGTSMACPHVAGACALIKSARPSMSWTDLKAAVLDNADGIAGLRSLVKTGGRLNVARAVIVSAGPLVTLSGLQVRDDNANGAAGNGDGVISPGETLAITVTIKNVGGQTANGLTSQLTLATADPAVTILRGSQTWGAVAMNAEANNATTPFLVRLAAGTATPHAFTLRLTSTDQESHSWTADSTLTAYTVSTVSGKVVALTGGAKVSGAVVNFSGTQSGSVVTDVNGTYSLKLLDGSYVLRTTAAGYNPSEPLNLTVPPGTNQADFSLGRSKLQVNPTSLTATQFEDVITHQTLTLSNQGDTVLTVTLGASSVGAFVSTNNVQQMPSVLDRLGAAGPDERPDHPPVNDQIGVRDVTAPPFFDSFENNSLAGWNVNSGAGTREITSQTAAVGSRSFHFVSSAGNNTHFSGINRSFAAGSKPGYVSFWVRAASTTAASGYFVVTDGGTDAIWFFARDTGKFYVNADVGGDESLPYQANAWYRVEFRNLDWNAKKFDYYVNGVLVKAGIPFRNPGAVSQVSNIYLYNFSGSAEAWWDDVRVSASEAGWITPSPVAVTLAPNQNTSIDVALDSFNLDAGTYQAKIDLYSNDPVNPVTNVPVTLTVQLGSNTPPVATNRTINLTEDSSASIALEGTDADGNSITAEVTELPAVGVLYQTADGTHADAPIVSVPAVITNTQRTVIYVSPPNANGTPLASFKFNVRDKRSTSAPATVTLNVAAVNDVPLAYSDVGTALPGQTIASIPVLVNDVDADGDTLTIASFTQGARGVVSNNGNGTLRYVPNGDFSQGSDSFSYTVSDGHGGTASATVSVTLGYLAAGPWPTIGNGAAHTGYYPATLAGQPLVPNWAVAFGGPLNPAAIAESKVFATPSTPYGETQISAVDLATGVLSWRRNFVQARTVDGPSYHQGRVYVQRSNSDDSQLWSLDSRDGSAVWSAPFGSQYQRYLPPAVTDTGAFIGGGPNGGIYGFDRAGGGQLFFQTLPAVDGWTPTVADGVVLTCANGSLIGHHPTTGARNWTYVVDATWSDGKVVAYESGRAYVAGASGLFAVNVSSTAASLAWKASGSFTGMAAVANGRVYAISNIENKVQAFNTTSGALIGDYLTSGVTGTGQPLVTNDTVVVASANKVFLFDLVSRNLLQTINYGGWVSLSNGSLIIAGSDSMLRSYTVGGSANQAPVAVAQTVNGTEDEASTVPLGGSDGNNDPLIALISTLPAKGALYQTNDGVQLGAPITSAPARVLNPQRKVIYRGPANGFGTPYASFSFKVNDGTINSAEAAVTINLSAVNDAPVAVDDQVSLRAGQILDSYFPTANDLDPDGEILPVISFTQPGHGAVSQNGDGSLRYVPTAGFTEGNDSFQYTARDVAGLTTSATVRISVSASFGNEWPTFGNGPEHTGYYPGLLGFEPLVQRWQYATGVSVNPLAVAEGKVFYGTLGNQGGYLYAVALDAVTGSEAWRVQFQPGNSLNAPSYFKGSLYLQRGNSGDAQLWALNAASGSVKWSAPYDTQSGYHLAPAVSDLGVFVNGGMFGGLYGFNQETGVRKFSASMEQEERWTPSLWGGGLYSFIDGKFRNHDLATGAINWALDFGWANINPMSRTAAFEAGYAYLVNDSVGGSELICIDLANRAVLWRVSGAFTGTPAVASGIVYALADGSVKSYGSLSGVSLGDAVAPGENALADAPLITGDLIIAASAARTYIFSRAGRALLQTLNFGSQVAVADDVVYFACSDKMIRAYGRNVPGNHVPVAHAAQVGILEEAEVAVRLEATDDDHDPLRFVVRSLPSKGALYQTLDGTTRGAAITQVPVLVQNAQGVLIYQAPLDLSGPGVGAFTFTAHDRVSGSVPAAVQIDITPVNDAPVAVPDFIALRPGEVLTNFHPELNDRDVDGDPLSIVSFTQGSSGQVALGADGSLQYTPNAGFISGTDSFGYTIRDAAGLSSNSTVNITISATLGREWPTFGANPEHTGYQPINLGTAAFTPRWTNSLGKSARQVAVADGRVYASLMNTALVALDASAGSERWRVNFASAYSINPPTAFSGDVYLQYGSGTNSRMYALNGATGETRWSTLFAAQTEKYLAPVVDSTWVYANGGYLGGLYGFNRSTGTQVFFQALEQYDEWTPALSSGGLYSFVAGKLRSHSRTTGATLWTRALTWASSGSSMTRSVACSGGVAYLVNQVAAVPTAAQELTAIDLTTQAVKWTVRGTFTGTPAVAHNAAFVLADGNSVKIYDAATGRFWGACTAAGETGLSGQPIVTGDTVIAYSSTKTYIFDLKTRQLRQTLNYGGFVSLAGNSLYIASPDNSVRAFAVPDALNRPPTAQPLTQSTLEDVQATVVLQGADPDSDPLTYTISRLPQAGTVYQTADGVTRGAVIAMVPATVTSSPARVIYVPPQDRNGAGLGNFGYAASDGKTLSAEAAVVVNVAAVNDAPVAQADQRSILPGQILSPVRETLNDLDADGDALHVVAFTQPAQGEVVQNTDGSLRYHPPFGATSGTEQFNYTIEDPAGARSTATVSVTIVPEIQGYWPTFGGGADHTGYTSTTLGRSGWGTRWSYQASGMANQAAIAGGRIFLTANGSTPSITALGEKTGQQLWQRTFAPAVSMNPPTYFEGKVYAQRSNQSADSQLIAVDGATGVTAFSSPYDTQLWTHLAPAVSSLGAFVNGGSSGGIYGYHEDTGAQRFFFSLPQADQWTPAILANELFSFVNGTLTSHNPASGASLWSVSLGWGGYGYAMNRTVALQGRSAYLINDSPTAVDNDEDLVCINLDTHAVVWSINGNFTGTPAINLGTVYAISGNTVQARSASDGHLLATYTAPAGEFLTDQPLITDDLVIAKSSEKTYAFGRYDQMLVQTFNQGGQVSVADDQIIIVSGDGLVSAFAAQPAVTFSPSGGTFAQPVNVTLSAAEPDGTIYYTVDGSAPELTSPTVASGQTVRISWSGKIRAILVKNNAISRINEATFTMLDSDNDGLPDWWETARFGNLSATSGSVDSDGDGVSDRLEFAAGTDVLDRHDFFGISKVSRVQTSGDQIQVRWPSKTDRVYVVEETTNFATWKPASDPAAGTGAEMLYIASINTASPHYYRVRVTPRVMSTSP